MAVVANAAHERQDGSAGLDGVLRALRAVPSGGPGGPGGPLCCTWACSAVVGEAQARIVGSGPDTELDRVLVRRFADRYLRVVAERAAGRPVPRVWQLLLDPPSTRPAGLALAGVGTLLSYDLTLAVVGTCTVLGRTPGRREQDAHRHVAAVLGLCVRELVRRSGDAPDMAAAARLDDAAARDAAWARATRLWALRGRPAEAEEERDTLDREVRADAARVLSR